MLLFFTLRVLSCLLAESNFLLNSREFASRGFIFIIRICFLYKLASFQQCSRIFFALLKCILLTWASRSRLIPRIEPFLVGQKSVLSKPELPGIIVWWREFAPSKDSRKLSLLWLVNQLQRVILLSESCTLLSARQGRTDWEATLYVCQFE